MAIMIKKYVPDPATAMHTSDATQPSMHFSLTTKPASQHAARLGNVILNRSGFPIPTPNLLTSTSRGVVPHLSRDHYDRTGAIRWVNVPFETL